MDWKRLLAYITGTVDQELLLRNAYLVTENRILRNQLQGRVRLSDGECQSLEEIGKKLGRQALEEIRHALTEYVTHVHQERPHQGQGNVVLLPAAHQSQRHTGLIHCHERLGGLLKYDHRQAT